MSSIKRRESNEKISEKKIPEKSKSEPPMGHKRTPALSCKTEVDTAFKLLAGD